MDQLKPVNVLISLYKGYGLGDSVQVSIILQHLRYYHPNWIIDYQAEEGKHQVGRGIVNGTTFAYGMEQPNPHKKYDLYYQIVLHSNWEGYTDRPNTSVVSFLKKQLGIDWDKKLGRYKVEISKQAKDSASKIVPRKAVAIHYQGDNSPEKKNLSHEQAYVICDVIKRLGYIPLLIDWRNTSPVRYEPQVISVGGYDWSYEWGSSIEMNCAVIDQCFAFIGIDSGPAKCASSTDIPSLVVWTGHHPIQYHDPAPYTTHLVPQGFHALSPVSGNLEIIDWFCSNYRYQVYQYCPITQLTNWLLRTLT